MDSGELKVDNCGLPNGWEVKKLGDVCKVFSDGDWIEKKDQSSDGIRLIQTGNIGFGYFKDKKEKSRYISEKTFDRLKCTEIFSGDLLVSRLPDPVGKSCIIPNIKSKMITSVDCTIIRPMDNLLSNFLAYYQMSNQYLSDIQLNVTGATRQRISRKNLGLIPIPIPPLAEQKQIVTILDKAFTAIDTAKTNAEQNLQNAKELFESYLQNIFDNGKLKIESGEWEEKKLNEISENLDRQRVPITKKNRVKGNIPYYGASGIVDYIDDFLFDEDLLLISEDGANLLARTYPIAFSISGKNWVNNHAHVLKFNNITSQYFVEYYFNSIKLDNFVSGMAQPKLNQTQLNKIPIPFPKSLDEQKQIVKKLDTLQAETKKLENIYTQKIADLEELKKSILQKAFSGQLRMDNG